jgi:hypothetical protein
MFKNSVRTSKIIKADGTLCATKIKRSKYSKSETGGDVEMA